MTTNLEVKQSPLTTAPQPVRLLLARALVELVENGWSEPGGWFLLEHGHQVLWLEEDGAPVAVATAQVEQAHGMLWLPLVYVVPERRRQGLFKTLLQRARFGARMQRLSSVQLGTHRDNAAMRAAVESSGMQPTFTRYVVPVPTEHEALIMPSVRPAESKP